MSLPISSVVSTIPVYEPAVAVRQDHPRAYFFTSEGEAMAWRDSLTTEEEAFLYRLDRYLARMKADTLIDTDNIIKQGTRQLFYRCLSYILTFTGTINLYKWSEDYGRIQKL